MCTLSNLEKETVILFNEADQSARIETFDRRLLRQLRKVSTCEGVSFEVNEPTYGVFTVPKTMIKIHAPHTINMSEEQRKASSERIKAYHAQRRKIDFEG